MDCESDGKPPRSATESSDLQARQLAIDEKRLRVESSFWRKNAGTALLAAAISAVGIVATCTSNQLDRDQRDDHLNAEMESRENSASLGRMNMLLAHLEDLESGDEWRIGVVKRALMLTGASQQEITALFAGLDSPDRTVAVEEQIVSLGTVDQSGNLPYKRVCQEDGGLVPGKRKICKVILEGAPQGGDLIAVDLVVLHVHPPSRSALVFRELAVSKGEDGNAMLSVVAEESGYAYIRLLAFYEIQS